MKNNKTIWFLIPLIILTSCSVRKTASKILYWIGGPTVIINLGSFKILTDPMFSSKGEKAFEIAQHSSTGEKNVYIQRFSQPVITDTSKIDVLLISHLHTDHFDVEARNALNKSINVIASTPNAIPLKEWDFNNVSQLNWDETFEYKKKGMSH